MGSFVHINSLSCFFLFLILHFNFLLMLIYSSAMKNMCQCCFFSGDCFRSIISLKKAKKVKVHSTTEKSNELEENSTTQRESSSPLVVVANGVLQRNDGVSTEHKAAICIQTAFRTYMARKTLKRLKGAVRFNILIQTNDMQKQASSALSYIHSWSNIQAQIRARRHHMVIESRIKQKRVENQLKLEAKIHELEVDWCGSSETMEEILLRIQQREEAAVKRERAMAYAFTHQWRANPTQYLGQAYYSIGKENWGWSWKERWVAARPWEIRVQAHPNIPKTGHSKKTSKSDMKITLLTKPASSNGKGSAKAKKPADTIVDNPAAQEGSTSTVSSSRTPIPS